jgi:hypothetical protein
MDAVGHAAEDWLCRARRMITQHEEQGFMRDAIQSAQKAEEKCSLPHNAFYLEVR